MSPPRDGRRGHHRGFDDAWLATVGISGGQRRPGGRGGVIKWPHATEHRRGWREALEATRDEWRAAYEGEPTRLSLALDELTEAFDMSGWAERRRGEERSVLVRLGFVLPPAAISRALPRSRSQESEHDLAVAA